MSSQPTASGRNNPRLATQQAAPSAEEDARPLSAQLVDAAKAGYPVKPEMPAMPDVPNAPSLPSAPLSGVSSYGAGSPSLLAGEEEASAHDAAASQNLPSAPAATPQLRSMAERRAAAAAARQDRTGQRRRPRRRKWPKVLAGCLLFFLLATALTAGVSFAYLRWFAHDDAADIQGTWYLAGTDTPVTIDDGRIHLTSDVSYPYTLDTGDKTIQFSFANLAGAGTYRFSLDRNQLALVDGISTEASTMASDAAWMLGAVIALLQGEVLPPADENQEGLTLLSRTPASGPSAGDQLTDEAGAQKDADAKDGKNAEDGSEKGKKEKSSKDKSGKSARDKSDGEDSEKSSEKKAKGSSNKDDDGENAAAEAGGSDTDTASGGSAS